MNKSDTTKEGSFKEVPFRVHPSLRKEFEVNFGILPGFQTRRGQKRTQEKKERLLANLKACSGVIRTACRETGINRDTYYHWLKTDQEFAKQARSL